MCFLNFPIGLFCELQLAGIKRLSMKKLVFNIIRALYADLTDFGDRLNGHSIERGKWTHRDWAAEYLLAEHFSYVSF